MTRGIKHFIDRRYDGIIQACSGTLAVLVYVAAAAAPVCLLLYWGFDSSALDKRLLMRLLYGAQAVFLASILCNMLFRFRAWWRESLFVKRMADGIMLLTLIPLLWPFRSWPAWEAAATYSRVFLFCALGMYSLAELSYGIMQLLGRRTNPSLLLSASFLIFIIIGSFVLMLPRCTTGSIRYIDALFMASSAVSMTGLCTVDVATTFTPLGWTVLAVLMQIALSEC